jgi:hypothetical protein
LSWLAPRAESENAKQRGESKVRKVLLPIVVVVLLLVTGIVIWSVMFASGNGEPIPVEGSWTYEINSSSATGSGDKVFMNGTDTGTWEGSFEGTSTGRFSERGEPSGYRTYEEKLSFEGTVEDEEGRRRQGTLEIRCAGERVDRNAPWEGTCEIVEGDGELANLHGSVTFTSPEDFLVFYSGQIQFESKPFWCFW